MQENGRKQASKVSSRVEELLGIVYPIIQAPFGGFASQRLAATVSNLGGLGSLGVVSLSESAIRDAVVEMLSLTNKPFAVNLWVSTSDPQLAFIDHDTAAKKIVELAQYYAELGVEAPAVPQVVPKNFEAQCYAAINAGAPVLSFVYGIPPSEILAECRRKSVRTIATATTPEEALELERAGIDLIVASGLEGGGHRGSFLRSPVQSLVGSFSLIPQVVDAVQIPVVAAGGIADGRGLKAALALGAEGVQIGTAFLACAGSGANTTYREALLSKDTTRTELTDKFTGRLARGIKNHLMDELSDIDSTVMPFPLQHALIQTVAQPASMRDRADLMTMWAGQSVGLCHHADVAELMTELIAALEDIRKRRENSMSETVSGTTIYQRIGGEAAISAAVDRFYERVLADPTLSHFFSGLSMGRLKAHQFAFLSKALGGPKQYSGASVRDAHSRLAIEQRHFDSAAVHLVETLRELGVPEDVISEIAAAVTPLSSQIVNTHLGQ